MLKMSDVKIDDFLPFFANIGVKVAFLVPTPTGYEKSIMDAIASVRDLLKETGIHDYEKQKQGVENKKNIKTYFVYSNYLEETEASLYRPVTKKGDPRIWFKNLKKYCKPCNLLAIIIVKDVIYVINLSNRDIFESIKDFDFVYDVLKTAVYEEDKISYELLDKLKIIHKMGFIKTITLGDTGVGDTLENALGISRNNKKIPDYKGIELKSTRLIKSGIRRIPTRATLFTKVPDEGLTYRQILEKYGKIQIPKGMIKERLQLYETCSVLRKNAYDLQLFVESDNEKLDLLYIRENTKKFVSAWIIKKLQETLLIKHRETFWIKAVSEFKNGVEFFRYDIAIHTKKPNASLIAPLLEEGKITVDLAAHIENNKYRDHGVLFKIRQEDIPLLFSNPIEYVL